MSTKLKATVRRKHDEAKARQLAWTTLTPQQRLASLDTRPGQSKKERARILASMNTTSHNANTK
jgi:hypothetical protein